MHRSVFQVASTILIGLFIAAGAPALAQEDAKPKLLATYDVDGKMEGANIKLRPNVTTPIYLHIQNSGTKATMPVQVRLLAEDDSILAVATLPPIDSGKTVRIRKWDNLSKPGVVAPANPIPGFLLSSAGKDGIRLRVSVTVENEVKQELPITLLQPRDYLSVASATFKNDEVATEIQVTQPGVIGGSACPIRLDINREDVPNLDRLGAGDYQGELDSNIGKASLSAKLRWAGPRRDGQFAVSADGWDRAFVFTSNFPSDKAEHKIDQLDRASLRIIPAKRYSQGDKLPIRVETSRLPDGWEIAPLAIVLRKEGKPASPVKQLIGARQREVRAVAADNGSLAITATVKEWSFELPVSGRSGEYELAAVLGAQDKPLLAATSRVTLGVTAPELVRIAMPTEGSQIVVGEPIKVAASAQDDLGFSSATFFFGKPTPDHKAPADAKLFAGKTDGSQWRTELPAVATKGAFRLGVIFTNVAGLSDSAWVEVDAIEGGKKAEGTGSKKGSIAGQITDGGSNKVGKLKVAGSGGRPQPNLKVQLIGPANKKYEETTDDQGNYLFKDLPAGAYTVSARKVVGSGEHRGSASVDLGEGEKKKDVDIGLKLP